MSESTEVAQYDAALFPELLSMDPTDVRERMARRFLAAETVDDLFDVMAGSTTKDMVGRKIRVLEVAWAPYESDRGIIPLAVCQAADLDTGEALEFATTSDYCTMFIRRAELIGSLPVDVKITSRKTRSGQTALNFERP